MAPHSSTLAWKIPWMEEPGGLQSMGSLRVGHNSVTSLSFSLSCIGEGNGNPLQCACLENPRDNRAWWAAVYGVAQSRTRLKRLSSSSSSILQNSNYMHIIFSYSILCVSVCFSYLRLLTFFGPVSLSLFRYLSLFPPCLLCQLFWKDLLWNASQKHLSGRH